MYEQGSELARQIDEAAENSGDDNSIQVRPKKVKRERTEAQIKAWAKAQETRKTNLDAKRSKAAEDKAERAKDIRKQRKKAEEDELLTQYPEESERPPTPVPAPRKPRAKKVEYVSDYDSSSEEEVVAVVKRRKKAKPKAKPKKAAPRVIYEDEFSDEDEPGPDPEYYPEYYPEEGEAQPAQQQRGLMIF